MAVHTVMEMALRRLRQTLGHGALEGRRELWLRLPPDAWVDIEAMQARGARAEAALTRCDFRGALEAAQGALALTDRRLLPEFAEPWVEERRRELDERRHAMCEICARAGLALGGVELLAAERAAQALVELNP
jgi:SARP family transcriptional regulator, regulator of embCAB operon